MSKNLLRHCDSLVSSVHFTFCHESLDQKKFNDHFIISDSLFLNDRVRNSFILDDGDNPSDHLPLLMTLSFPVLPSNPDDVTLHTNTSIAWNKVSSESVKCYADELERLLLLRGGPSLVSGCHFPCGCTSDVCRESIQDEYDYIIECITNASNLLPRCKGGAEKDW